MKKFSKFMLIICVILSMVVAMVSCTTKPSTKGPAPWDGTFTEDGAVSNGKTAKTYVASKADSRANAFAAFKADKTKIAEYKSLAGAISAATESGIGAYVEKLSDSTLMFFNREGYDKEGANDDCFWYYENGVSLDAFDCWDTTGTMGALKNTKLITTQTRNYGKNSFQGWNSYGVLGSDGAVADVGLNAWVLSNNLDASSFTFPKVRNGITRATYDIDLSGVKITPAYSTSDKVYAFMGYYMWQDYYVINVGIACDTSTGNWYPYIGTSRDDSASDTVYATEGCIMTSTYNEAGYFVPDATSITLSAQSKLLEDAEGTYQVNDFLAKTNDGSVYARRITDSTVNTYFPGKGLSLENSFVFVAGMDVKNEISYDNFVKPVDFFNGAKFENLAVTKAVGYVPTEEEITEVDYGYTIELERGKEHNMLMATSASTAFDYNVLNNNVCSSYTKGEGKDIYSFNFDLYNTYNPTTSNSYSAATKVSQDKIDALKTVTEQNVMDKIGEITAVDALYGTDGKGTGSTLANRVYNVLNFAPYLAAKQVVAKVMSLDAATQKVADDFKTMPNLGTYIMKGWKPAVGATDLTGILYSDIEKMRLIVTAFNALSEDMKIKIFFHINQTSYEDWALLCTEITAAEAHAKFSDVGFNGYGVGNDIKGAKTVVTPDKALAQIAYWMLQIKNGGKWGGTADLVMNSDNSFQPSEFIVNCREYLEKLEINVPTYYKTTLIAIGYESFARDYQGLKETVKLGSLWNANATDLTIKSEITAQQATILTKYWGIGWQYNDGGINWNIKNPTALDARLANTAQYFLTTGTKFTKFSECFNNVVSVLKSHAYTMDTARNYRVSVETIEAKAGEALSADDLSVNGLAFYNGYKAIGAINKFVVKGWEAAEDEPVKTGFIKDAAKSVATLKIAYDALEQSDKDLMAKIFKRTTIAAELTAWVALNTEIIALEANEKFTADTKYDVYTAAGAVVKVTAKEALLKVLELASQISTGKVWESADALGKMNMDNCWKESVYIYSCYQAIIKDAGLTVTACVSEYFTAIGFDAFEDAHLSLATTVGIAQAIKNGNYTTLSELSEAQLADLNKYWVKGYEISTYLKWNWNSGNKFEMYCSGRVKVSVLAGGGTLMKEDGTTALKCFEYFKIVEDFLKDNGYTANANGWGVTADAIKVAPAPAT